MKEQQVQKPLEKNKIRISVEYNGETTVQDYDKVHIEEERNIGKDFPDESPRSYTLNINASKIIY